MRIGEVNAVVLEVLQPFNLVPLELHLRSVYTPWTVCNAGACCPITCGSAAARRSVMRAACAHVSTYHGPLQPRVMCACHRTSPTATCLACDGLYAATGAKPNFGSNRKVEHL